MGKNILITPGDALINFSGASAGNVNLQVQDDGRVSFVGISSGAEQLTITDSLSGSVFTVNNSFGSPIIDVDFDNTITIPIGGADGYVWTSDSGGTATWQESAGSSTGSCIDTLWVSTISGCSPVHIGPYARFTGNNSKLTIGGVDSIEVDSWAANDGESSVAIQTISGGTTGTTVIGSDAMIMTKKYDSPKSNTSSLTLGDTRGGMISYASTPPSSGLAIQTISGGTTGTTVIGSDAMIMTKYYDSSNNSKLTIGDDTDDDGDAVMDVFEPFPMRIKLRTISGGTTGTTVIGSAAMIMTKKYDSSKSNTSSLVLGGIGTEDSTDYTIRQGVYIQSISGGTTGTTIMTSSLLSQQSKTPDTTDKLTIGWSAVDGIPMISYASEPSSGLVIQSKSGTTTGTTIMGSDSLLMNKSLATNVKTTTNIYPSYTQYSFSTTGMTGTSITSASKIYSSFKNNRFTNFIGAYSVTNSGGDGGCDCADQYCGSGQLCAGSGNAGTDCHCMGDSEGGDGMYTVGSIDTVSGTTGTTMITSTGIYMVSATDEDGTNLLTINSEGINITNETEGFTSEMPRMKTIAFNHEEIKGLGTAGKLISAPGVGKMLKIVSVSAKIAVTTTPYDTSTTLNFKYTGADYSCYESSELLLSDTDRIINIVPVAGGFPLPGASDTQLLENAGFEVVTDDAIDPQNGTGNIVFHCIYYVIDALS